MNKEELRALYIQIRRRMSKSEVSSKSRIISRRLINEIDWLNHKNVCVYQPVASLNEVDISGLLIRLRQQPQIDLYIIEPHLSAVLPKKMFDLILVPCLAFDDKKYRLGWGGGWFDKFLAEQPGALKVGLCFQNGYVRSLPHEPHDIVLDRVITEV